MNVVVFGEDIYTCAVIESLIESGHTISLIVTPEYFNENYKVLEETAFKYHIEFVKDENVNAEKIKEHLKRIKPELIIAVHLRKLLSREIFSQAARGAINVHPSLLPKYRGLSPQHQAILHGDNDSGVTVHFIDADADTGEIIIQKKFPVSKEEYILDVQSKMLGIYKTIVVEAINRLEDVSFKPKKQDLSQVSYFGPLRKSDRKIDLTKPKQDVYRLIRAVSLPYKGAFYDNYTIWVAKIPDQTREAELKTKYPDVGFYFNNEEDEIVIRLNDGILVSDDFEIK
jgi:methionyl-tRNA formyltransferase